MKWSTDGFYLEKLGCRIESKDTLHLRRHSHGIDMHLQWSWANQTHLWFSQGKSKIILLIYHHHQRFQVTLKNEPKETSTWKGVFLMTAHAKFHIFLSLWKRRNLKSTSIRKPLFQRTSSNSSHTSTHNKEQTNAELKTSYTYKT